jgi:cysteine desulfurase
VGALYIREGIRPEIFCHGAGQERGIRAGTENVLEIVGLGRACEIAARDLTANQAHMAEMRDRLEAGLQDQIPDLRINGHPIRRLPNTSSISFAGLEANRLLEEIGREVAASAGAACHADSVQLSHVLEAMKVPLTWAMGTIRLSTGRMTTGREIDRAVAVIAAAVRKLRG